MLDSANSLSTSEAAKVTHLVELCKELGVLDYQLAMIRSGKILITIDRKDERALRLFHRCIRGAFDATTGDFHGVPALHLEITP
jgi:hypothetical protein